MVEDITEIVMKKAFAFRKGALTTGAKEASLRRESEIKKEVDDVKTEFEQQQVADACDDGWVIKIHHSNTHITSHHITPHHTTNTHKH